MPPKLDARTKKLNAAAARVKKKISQLTMLLSREKDKDPAAWDWHSFEHLFADGHCVSTATKHGLKESK